MNLTQVRLGLSLACLLASTAAAQSIINEVGLERSRTLAFTGDLNGDGISELLVGRGSGAFKVRVIDGHTGALLYGVGSMGDGALGRGMAGIGDADGDGVPDFVIGRPGYVRLVSGIDGSTLGETTDVAQGFGRALARVGDLDGDGAMDWAAASADHLRVYSSASGQVLRSLPAPSAVSAFYATLQSAGDLDGDGLDELLVAWIQANGPDEVVLVSGSSGAFLQSWSAELNGVQPVCLAGDVDADGTADVAILNQDTGRVSYYSTQSGGLITSTDARGWAWSQALLAAAGDLNGDGRDDLWVGYPMAKGPFGALSGVAAVYSVASGEVLMRHSGGGGYRNFGSALVTGEDLDGDGIGDTAILGHGFDAIDSLIRLVSSVCNSPLGRSFCPTSPNSVGPGARLGLSAPASASALTLDVSLRDGVPGNLGVLMITRSGIPTFPFGDGTACVLPFLLWQGGAQMTNAGGNASIKVPLSQLNVVVVPGDTLYLQYRYRDPAGPLGTGFNYSNGHRVTFCQ